MLFYWVKDVTDAPLKCSVWVRGVEVVGRTSAEVRRPEVDWVLTPRWHVEVTTNQSFYPGTFVLTTGRRWDTTNFTDVGMLFEFTVRDMKGYPYRNGYQFQFVQIVTTDRRANHEIPHESGHLYGRGLDGPYPYKSWTATNSGLATDTPHGRLDSNWVFHWRSGDYESYLMFEPALNGIPVPLKLATWNWNGRAERTTNSPLTFVGVEPFTDPQSAVGTDCFDHPEWTINVNSLTPTFSTNWYPTP